METLDDLSAMRKAWRRFGNSCRTGVNRRPWHLPAFIEEAIRNYATDVLEASPDEICEPGRLGPTADFWKAQAATALKMIETEKTAKKAPRAPKEARVVVKYI